MLRILLQPAVLVTSLILILVSFICPDPLSSSGVSLMVISPVSQTANSNATNSANTIAFGLPSSTSASGNNTMTSTPQSTTNAYNSSAPLLQPLVGTSQGSATPNQQADPSQSTPTGQSVVTPANTFVQASVSNSTRPVSNVQQPQSPPTSTTQQPVVYQQPASGQYLGPRQPSPAQGVSLPLTPQRRYEVTFLTEPLSSRIAPRQVQRPSNSTDTLSLQPSSPALVTTQNERINRTSTFNDTDANGSPTQASNATATALPETSSASYHPTGEQLSLVEMKFGPLGSCVRTSSSDRTCTPPSLNAQYMATKLASDSLTYDISGLPTKMKTSPILLLTAVVVLLALLLLAAPAMIARCRPDLLGEVLESGPWQRYYDRAQRMALWVRLSVVSLLLVAGISMRTQISKAVYAFNANNASILLPDASLRPEVPASLRHQIGLSATVGHAFTLLWVSIILLLVECWLERARLKREEAVRLARGDLEAKWGRDALEYAMGKLDTVKARPSVEKVDSSDDTVAHSASETSFGERIFRRKFGVQEPPLVARKPVPAHKGGLGFVLSRTASSRSAHSTKAHAAAAPQKVWTGKEPHLPRYENNTCDSGVPGHHRVDCPPYVTDTRCLCRHPSRAASYSASRAPSKAPSRAQSPHASSTYTLPCEDSAGSYKHVDGRRPFEDYATGSDDGAYYSQPKRHRQNWQLDQHNNSSEEENEFEEQILSAKLAHRFAHDDLWSKSADDFHCYNSATRGTKRSFHQGDRSVSAGGWYESDNPTPVPLYDTRIRMNEVRSVPPRSSSALGLTRQRSSGSLVEIAGRGKETFKKSFQRNITSRKIPHRASRAIIAQRRNDSRRSWASDDDDEDHRYDSEGNSPVGLEFARARRQYQQNPSRSTTPLSDPGFYQHPPSTQSTRHRPCHSPSASMSSLNSSSQLGPRMGLRNIRYIKP